MEQCDDENVADDDDCTSACMTAFCGDGIVHADDEECDDANMADNDACTAQCTMSFCGDGVLWADMETCDDGNMSDTDACPSSCMPAFCGDGFEQMGVEQCDDANMLDSDNCVDGCIDGICGDGFVKVGVESCDDGNMIDNDACPNNCGIIEVGCMDILTNMNVWGNVARGVDLRAYTNSTLHWIGCANSGCESNSFYCNYDPVAHTMQFGTMSQGAMRSLVDPNDANGDAIPNSFSGCCAMGNQSICNAPNSANNGNGNVVMVEALCASLGYSEGSIVREVNNNSCPKPAALTADGTSWTSNYVNVDGFGAEYLCSN
jgi:cysteine-rich repeat protein